jgi:hypothetical protein
MRAYHVLALIASVAVMGCSSSDTPPKSDAPATTAPAAGSGAKKPSQGMGLPGLGPGAKDAENHVGSKAGG